MAKKENQLILEARIFGWFAVINMVIIFNKLKWEATKANTSILMCTPTLISFIYYCGYVSIHTNKDTINKIASLGLTPSLALSTTENSFLEGLLIKLFI